MNWEKAIDIILEGAARDLLGYLPPVPPGYAIGYFYGYCVVYDPVTFTILNFVDLLS